MAALRHFGRPCPRAMDTARGHGWCVPSFSVDPRRARRLEEISREYEWTMILAHTGSASIRRHVTYRDRCSIVKLKQHSRFMRTVPTWSKASHAVHPAAYCADYGGHESRHPGSIVNLFMNETIYPSAVNHQKRLENGHGRGPLPGTVVGNML